MKTEYDFKEQKRDVPTYKPMGCLPQLVLGMAVLAFIGLATWIVMTIFTKM